MKKNLSNNESKVMLITGAARRIGAAMSNYFHAKGFRLLLHYCHSQTQASQLAKKLNQSRPNSVKLIQADFTEELDYVRWLKQGLRGWDRLDVLINNASGFYPTQFGSITVTDWNELFATNAKTPLFLSQAAFPLIKKQQGTIINLIDAYHPKARKKYLVYSIAKASLQMLTMCLAKECAPFVRVNAVAPGVIDFVDNSEDKNNQESKKILFSQIPLNYLGKADDIVAAVDYLVSANYVTGETINVDGGRRIGI